MEVIDQSEVITDLTQPKRLKKQLKKLKAARYIAERQKAWAYLFITQSGNGSEFCEWLKERDFKDPHAQLISDMEAMREQSKNVDTLEEQLKLSQLTGKMYEEQKNSFYKMINTLNGQIDNLQSMLGTMIEKTTEQNNVIADLKQKLSQYEAKPTI